MIKVFLINELVAFYPHKNLLVNTREPEIQQILGRPSSRCLEILLADPGAIVSHQTLYDMAWEGSVHETSPNTLYQTILLTRKALKFVSESDEDFIITVPRKGFAFNEKMQVKVEQDIPDTTNESHASQNSLPADGKKEKWKRYLPLQLKISTGCVSLVVGTLGVIALLISGYKYFLFKQDEFTYEYEFYQKSGGCDLYLRQPVSIYKNEIDIFLRKHEEITTDCQLYPFRFISIVSRPITFYVIECNKFNGPKRNCTLSYIRNE